MDTLRNTFWVATVCLLGCFSLFVVLGAFSTEAVGLFAVMGVLAVLYAAHLWNESRHVGPRDPRLLHDRERRGF